MASLQDFNIIDVFLRDYTVAIKNGFGLIQGDVTSVFSILIVITIGITAVYWAIDETGSILPTLFRKIMLIGFFIYVVNDWQGLTSTIIRGFVQLGLKAGASTMTPDTFMTSPGDLVIKGWHHCVRFLQIIDSHSGPIKFFEYFTTIALLLVATIGTLVAFFILSIQLLITIIEFRLVTLAAFILIPFGILKQTSFLAERAFGYVVSSGLKLLTIAMIVSIGGKTFDTIPMVNPGADMLAQALSITFAAVILMMLAVTVPSLAAALVTGGPQLGAGAALAGTAGVAASVGGAYLAGRALAQAPGAIAAKAQAAAGAQPTSASTGPSASPGGGAGLQPANPPNGGGGGGGDGLLGPQPSTNSSPNTSNNRAPSTAPSPKETVRRATVRRALSTPANAQAAIAAANSQGGAGLSAPINHSES